ncbi:MAG TPA: outer membrane lipoprotein-sorting protein [Geothrix sp.]|nr:outer membrane lipoprotein-sorting protein [Geothrix sp.]
MRPALLLIAALPILAQEAPAEVVVPGGEELLARVDRLRHPWPSFTVELTVKDANASAQRWKVSARDNGDARLDGLSDKEKGRSVLMLGDQMWLLLPGTRRPLKVTPQQRMMGSAAGGDVARTRFRQDYAVQKVAEDSLAGQACWRLDLSARSAATSARTVRLWVTRDRQLPLRADFHLASGKLARTALFGPPVQALGQPVLSRMELVEPGGQKVELAFGGWGRGGVDPGRFELPGTR